MKKILIIEDEYPAAQKLSKMINDLGEDTQIVAVLDSVEAALAYLHQKPLLDLIFSDIQLSDGLSFSIFEQISPQAPIIFTTSYDEYALRAFKVASIDYLLKPIKKQELEQAYQKYKTFFEKKEGSDLYQQQLANLLREVGHKPKNELQRFLVKHQEQIIPIGTEQVAYFFTNNKMLCMVLKNAQQYLIDYTLEQLEEILNPEKFFRLNRQFIASVDSIAKIHLYFNGKLKIELQPYINEEVVVSREKNQIFQDWLQGNLGK